MPVGIYHHNTKNEKNPNWKGYTTKVDYSWTHKWVNREFGRPKKCEFCRTTNAKTYEWHNLTRTYTRTRKEWMRLCKSCHMKNDRYHSIDVTSKRL